MFIYMDQSILEIDHQLLAFVNRAKSMMIESCDGHCIYRCTVLQYRFHVCIVKGNANTAADLFSCCGLQRIYYHNMCYLKGETVVTMWIIHVK